MTNNDYDADFDAWGQRFNVDPQLVKTVFHIESGGNPGSRDSYQGAQGGMQMMPGTAAEMAKVVGIDGPIDPHSIRQQIPLATAYLAQGLNATGSPEGALAYYHGGPDQSQWGPKTAAYVARGQAAYPQMTVTAPAKKGTAPVDQDTAAGVALLKGAAGGKPKEVDADTAAGMALLKASAPPAVPATLGEGYSENGTIGAPQMANQPAPAPQAPVTADSARAAMQDDPNVGSILPIRTDPATGAPTGLAVPNSLRALGRGALDLIQGPMTGTVTPEATMALASGMIPGAMPRAVAEGTGAAIGNRLIGQGRNEFAGLPEGFNPLASPQGQEAVMRAATPEAAAAASQGAPMPQSVGAAAASPDESNMSPREMEAYRKTAEMDRTLAPAQPGVDTTEYVPGVQPTKAEYSGDPKVSQAEALLRQRNPEPFNGPNGVLTKNNEARVKYYDDMAGTPAMIQARRWVGFGSYRLTSVLLDLETPRTSF